MKQNQEASEIGIEILDTIENSQDSQSILLNLAKTLGKSFQANSCLAIAGTNADANIQVALWEDGVSSIPILAQKELLSQPFFQKILAQKEPFTVADLTTDEHFSALQFPWTSLRLKAVLAITTYFQNSANGIIVLGSFQPQKFAEQHQNLLKKIAKFITVAISQSQLKQQAHLSTKYQTLVKEMSKTISKASEPEAMLSHTLAEAAHTLQVDRGWLLMLKYANPLSKTEAKAKVIYHWSADTNTIESPSGPTSITNYSFWVTDCFLCQEALEKAPQLVTVANSKDLPQLQQEEQPACFFDLKALPALLLAPLMGRASNNSTQRVVLGFFVLQHHQPKVWQPEEIELVKWVSTQASTAVVHDQTLRQVQSLVEERTLQLRRSLEVQAMLYDKTRQQVEQLRRLNQLKDEFVTNMSHELKTPLASMKIAIRMLNQPQLSSEQQGRYFGILEQEWNREYNLIQDFLTLQDVESNQFVIYPQQFELQPVIEELVQGFAQKWQQVRNLNLELNYISQISPDTSWVMYTDLSSFKRIFQELLTNAGKFAPKNSTISFGIQQKLQGEKQKTTFSLTNAGSGISPEEQSYIFDPFRRGKGATEGAVPGTGLGLALVKCLVQHLNGTIDVSSSVAQDNFPGKSSFIVTLPQLNKQLTNLDG
ncbi:MAG: GAF domain-containing sensor histidine kinase [Spirulinaceae cyanobacterium]